MGDPRSSAPRRMLAVAAGLGVTASLLAGMSAPAGAEDGDRGSRTGPAGPGADVAVRPAPAAGAFTVEGATRDGLRGRGLRRESAASGSSLSPAAQRDLRRYSRVSGEDYEALVASHEAVDDLGRYAADLEARRPGLYAASGIGVDGGPSWVQLTRRPGPAELARLRALPFDTEVRYGAPASSAELARLSEELIDSVAARPGVVESAQASYDAESRRMVLSFKPATEAPAARVESAIGGALRGAVTRAESLPLPVVTREVDFETDQELTVHGGANLNFRGAAACTAGFTAVRNGNRGILTARHCPNRMTYNQRGDVLATRPAQTRDRRVDLQFHRVRASDRVQTGVQFRAYRNGRRTVTDVANAPRGSVACHWGRTTGFSCARVRATNQCVLLSGVKTCGLDATGENISAAGDSGGPWFLGNTARGIHAGGGGDTSLFTRIGRVSELGGGTRVLRR